MKTLSVARMLILLVFLNAIQAVASSGITYHGRILKPDGQTPVTSSTTQFKVQIRTPGGENCLLWEEQQTKDLSSTNGVFTLTINDTSEPTLIANALPYTLDRVFSNRTNFSSLTNCSVGSTYNPTSSDGRSLQVLFRESPSDPWEQMPLTKINFVPLALNTVQLEGYGSNEFLKISSASSYTPLTATQVNTLMDIIAGTNTQYLRPATTFSGDVSGTYSATSVDKIKGVSVTTTAPTNGQVLKYNGTAWAPAADDTGSTVSDASYTVKGIVQINTDLATSGLFISSGVLALPNVITAGGPTGGASTVPVITYDQKGRLTAVSTATVDDTTKLPLAGGTMTGNINMGTKDITNATNISSTNVSATNASVRNLILNDNDTNTVTIKTPTDVTANYTLTLPGNDGNSGQVLSTDGSGVLSWVAANSSLGLTANKAVIANGTGTALTAFSCSVNQVFSFDGAGNPTCADVTAAGGFLNGGNSFGANATLGTNDNYALDIKTNNISRMTILNTGNVGIGSAAPNSLLEVAGTMNARHIFTDVSDTRTYNTTNATTAYPYGSYLEVRQTSATDTTNAELVLNTRNGSSNFQAAYLGAISTTGASYTPSIVIGQQTAASGYTERVRIDSSGNFGIGTSAPNTALDVNGAISQRGMTAPSLSPAGQGRIYFDSTSNTFKVSQNGGAYSDLATTSGVSSSYVAKAGDTMTGTLDISKGNGLALQLGADSNGTTRTDSTFKIARVALAHYLNAEEQVSLLTASSGNSNNIVMIGGGANNWNAATQIGFYTAANTTTLDGTERLRIDSTGYIGMGTSSPTSTLDLNGALTQRGMAAPSLSAAGQGRIYFDSTSNTFKVSQNGGAYADLATTSGVSGTYVAKTGDTMTGALLLPDGTVNAPSLSFSSNTGTGISYTAGGGMTFNSGGITPLAMYSSSLRIPSSVFLATTNKGNRILTFSDGNSVANSDSTTNAFNLQNAASGANPKLSVTGQSDANVSLDIAAKGTGSVNFTNGNVGVGTTSPSYPFQVKKSGTGTSALFESTCAGCNSSINVFNAASAGLGTYSSIDFSVNNAGDIYGQIRGISTSAVTGDLAFLTVGGAGSLNEKMRLDTNGYLGIGTSSPATALDVNGAFTSRGMAAPSLSPAGQGRIYFDSTSNTFKVSQNGGAYSDLVTTSSLSSNFVSKSGDTMSGPLSLPGMTAIDGSNASIGLGLYGANTITFLTNSTAATTLLFRNSGGWNAAQLVGTKAAGSNNNGTLLIKTTGHSVDQVFLDQVGNVGIGTSSPSSTLTLNGALTTQGMAAPSVSSAGEGRIYFDSTSKTFKISQDGSSYSDLVTNASTGFLTTSAYNSDVTPAASCTTSQTPYWNTISDTWACQNINVTTAGGFFKDGGNSLGAAASLGTNDAFALNFKTNNSTKMTIKSTGEVGIGTTNPGYSLHVYSSGQAVAKLESTQTGGTNTVGINFVSAASNDNWSIATNRSDLFGANDSLGFYKNAGTTGAKMVINDAGNVGIGTSSPQMQLHVHSTGTSAATMYSDAATGATSSDGFVVGFDDALGAVVLNREAGALVLGTSNAERMRITSAGNVGIGTNSPSYTLDVNGNAYVNGPIITAGSGYVQTPNVYANGILAKDSGNPIIFYNSAATERMRISDTGNVGIGINNPTEKLHINGGTIKLTGSQPAGNAALYVNNGFLASASGSSLSIYPWISGSDTLTQVYGISMDSPTVTTGSYTNYTGISIGASTSATGNTIALAANVASANGHWNIYAGGTAQNYFNGNVGIGITYPVTKLHVVSSSGAAAATFSDGTQSCTITPATAGNISCSSDRRLKKNIERIEDAWALDKILQLEAVTYEWRNGDDKRHTGFIAQELEKVAPEFVTQDSNGYKQVSYVGLIPWLTSAIKELHGMLTTKTSELEHQNAELKRDIASVKSDNEELKRRLDALEKQLSQKSEKKK